MQKKCQSQHFPRKFTFLTIPVTNPKKVEIWENFFENSHFGHFKNVHFRIFQNTFTPFFFKYSFLSLWKICSVIFTFVSYYWPVYHNIFQGCSELVIFPQQELQFFRQRKEKWKKEKKEEGNGGKSLTLFK